MDAVECSSENPIRPMYAMPEGGDLGEAGGPEMAGGESRHVVQRRPPKGPTVEEREAHRKTHLPFRSWCPPCVEGRAKNWPHLKEKGEPEERYPSVSFDYCFLRDHQGGPSVPVLVGKDRETGALISHVVPEKGAGLEWTAKHVCRDLVKLGIGGKVVLKADQEPAIVSLIEDVIKKRGNELTVPEWSPKGESQSNGKAERGVQTIEGLVRSHKIDLEGKLGCKVPVESPLFTWLVEHCADLHNKFHVYADGQTSYEKIKGKKHKGEMLEFGQAVLHRVPGKPAGGLMAPRWLPGTWIGKRFSSEEHIIGMDNGKVVRTRAVRSLPAATMWNKEAALKVVGTPWKPSGEYEGEEMVQIPRAVEVKPEEPEVGPRTRGMKIMPKHLVKAGYTKGCPKCNDMRSGRQEHISRGHSEACRKRIEEVARGDEGMRKDVEKAEQRRNEYLTRHVENQDKEDTAKKRKLQTAEVIEEEANKGETPSSSSSSHQERPRAQQEDVVNEKLTPVPEDDGDIVLEEIEELGSAEVAKRKRKEDDDGGDDAPPTRCLQLPPVDEKRSRDDDEREEPAKVQRRTERQEYEKDMKKIVDSDAEMDFLGLTEKQNRKRGENLCDDAEIFSPPRTTLRAMQRGFKGGFSLDVLHEDPWTGRKWDLRDAKTKEAARNLVRRVKPKLLIASPPCTLFSQLQNLSGGVKDRERWNEAVQMVEFAVELCLLQHRAGRRFVFEHPAGASSWKLECLDKLREVAGVESVVLNMCRFGMVMEDKLGKGMIYKPTRICTNSPTIAEKTGLRCVGGHRHVHLESGRAKHAARYPEALSDAFLDGLAIEDANVGNVKDVLMQMAECPDMCDIEEEKTIQESLRGVDDVTGEPLNPGLIMRARGEEMGGFKEFGVYEYELREVAMKDSEGKFIGTRWVDTNKGTAEKPEVRSRLVGQEFARGEVRDDLFAATPPLTATRMLLSALASRGRQGPRDHRIMLLDVKKAFLYGKIQRRVYIELPQEDPMSKTGKYVGRLVKAMYGTRDAPQVWQAEVKKTMGELGFKALISTPCVYVNLETGVRAVAHVDDFLCTGPRKALKEFHEELSKKYQMKGQLLGPGKDEDKEGRFLGRTISWMDAGLEWRGDDKVRKALMKEWAMEGSSTVSTPGVKEDREKIGADAEIHDKKRIARFPCAAAQINYMSLDNPKLGFASKEISREMAKPTEEGERKVKRAVRYLQGSPSTSYRYHWQDEPDTLDGYADSDWAGFLRTRRSTSGGLIMSGGHLLAHWSRTQVGVALSSGEAELNAALKAGCELMGARVMADELGWNRKLKIHGDSSAAKGTLARQGSGKIKHLETKQLWLQERISRDELEYIKVPRVVNMADAFTHHWTIPDSAQHFRKMNLWTPTSTCTSEVAEGGCERCPVVHHTIFI